MRLALALATLIVLLVGCSGDGVDQFGGALYSSSCAHCHGSDLAGGVGPALGAGSNATTLTDQQIKDVVRIGPGAMTSFGDRFSEEQLDSLVVFLRSEQGE
jgi:mono/diheme cytochrome c family protein